jgi:cell division protein FtsI (penicillin-binding protein 3)
VNIKKSIVLRVRLAFLLVFLFCLAIIVKLVKIQAVDGEKWKKLAKTNVLQYRVVKAMRGNIYSDNGSLLATSLPFYKLTMDPHPTVVKDEVYRQGIDSLAFLLSRHFRDKSANEYKRRINDARRTGKRYLILSRSMINFQTKKMMSQWPIFREGRHKGGVIFERVDKRFRPFSYLAMRTIGFVNEDDNGVGLEKSFNKYLGGRDGEALFRRMAGSTWKPMHDESEIRPEEGYDIETTIDINLQDVAESSLNRHLTAHDADYGCVVLMEVATGQIKAIANLGKLPGGGYAENYNYAVGNQGLTDPGSTFKLASMIALLEDSEVQPTDSVETGNGQKEFYDRMMTDSKPHGKITVQEALALSSNIGVASLVNHHFGHKPEKYIEYIYNMGLADPIQFQMIGEAVPYIKKPSDKTWSGVTLPWMSIGYELKLSPLQMLTFYNGIANNGKMIQPIIVKQVKVADQVIEKYETKVLKEKLCSDRTLDIVKGMLEAVVEKGTARDINNTIYKIAGKTGTSQKIKNGQYTKSYYTSFIGYFPADKPKYSCIVVIDNPKGFKQYGSDVAAPVFKEVADKVYARDLDLHEAIPQKKETPESGVFPLIQAGNMEDLMLICNQLGISNHPGSEDTNDDEWVAANTKDNSVVWENRKIQEGVVPDVKGMTLRDAIYVLENKGMRVRYSGTGRVVAQSHEPDSKIMDGSIITIKLN